MHGERQEQQRAKAKSTKQQNTARVVSIAEANAPQQPSELRGPPRPAVGFCASPCPPPLGKRAGTAPHQRSAEEDTDDVPRRANRTPSGGSGYSGEQAARWTAWASKMRENDDDRGGGNDVPGDVYNGGGGIVDSVWWLAVTGSRSAERHRQILGQR